MASVERIDQTRLFLHDETITILTGEQKQRLMIHETAFTTSESSSLQTLVSESFKESNLRVVDWSHTDLPTVERFLTFLYLGDYNVPQPASRVLHSSPTHEASESVEALEAENETNIGDFDLEQKPEPIEEAVFEAPPEAPAEVMAEELSEPLNVDEEELALQNLLLQSATNRPLTPIEDYLDKQPPSDTVQQMAGVFSASDYPYAKFCYIEPLLAHVKLHIFASYHLCTTLQSLALRRFVDTLKLIDFDEEHSTHEVSILANYVYDNASPQDEEPLRKVISTFVATNYTQLLQFNLEDLFCLGGDFTRDVTRKILRQLISLQKSVGEMKQENKMLNQRLENADWGWTSSYNSNRRGRRR